MINNQEQFVHFLDGYLTDKTELTAAQTQTLKDKLSAVFIKVTPNLTNMYNNPNNKLYSHNPIDGGFDYSKFMHPVSC